MNSYFWINHLASPAMLRMNVISEFKWVPQMESYFHLLSHLSKYSPLMRTHIHKKSKAKIIMLINACSVEGHNL
jgi:hypothetical protein